MLLLRRCSRRRRLWVLRDRPAEAVPSPDVHLPLGGHQLVERLHFGAELGRGRDEALHLLGLHPEPLGHEQVQPRVVRTGLEAHVHPAEVEAAPQAEPRDGGRRGVQRHDELDAGQPVACRSSARRSWPAARRRSGPWPATARRSGPWPVAARRGSWLAASRRSGPWPAAARRSGPWPAARRRSLKP